MSVEVVIIDGPLPPAPPGAPESGDVGAVLVFEGVVRGLEGDRTIDALDYEAYRPMAERQMERLARALLVAFGVTSVRVEHSVGRVPVGRCSLRLTIRSAHRAQALAAAAAFIDALKRDVPIWKRPPR